MNLNKLEESLTKLNIKFEALGTLRDFSGNTKYYVLVQDAPKQKLEHLDNVQIEYVVRSN